MDYKQEAINHIISYALHCGLRVGHAYNTRGFWFNDSTLSLNPKIKDQLTEAFNSLIELGYFNETESAIILTEKGDRFIYNTPDNYTYEQEAKDYIISYTQKSRLLVGNPLFILGFERSLITSNLSRNAKEKLNEAFNSLIQEGIFEEDGNNIILTQYGYDYIY
ncbi:hypothetical protein [Providencia sp. PROV236]|uniref:hypothetical protein n=1 Tax=Providencia sp. PROV236 TaxID=2936798 RepID=UPI0034E1FB58